MTNKVDSTNHLFPPRLHKVKPPVKSLFYKGRWDLDIFQNTLAVVGSRRMTTYGQRVLEKLLPPLVQTGVTIVSGGMYGVDCQAHRLCVECGGATIAVLGWGIGLEADTKIDRLTSNIIDNRGLIVSEYDKSQKSQLWMFPQRNRIIAGLSRAVLVVEAGLGSGSLVTAKWARKFDVPVLAVPGPITSTTSEGTNFLIKSGLASAVTGVEDVLEVLQLVGEKSQDSRRSVSENNPILEALGREEQSVDDLTVLLHRSVSDIATEMSMLELEGKVVQRNGKYYKK